MERKVWAYRHSQEVDGRRVRQEEVNIVDRKYNNGTMTYIVQTQDGIYCTAIFNPFTCVYYADDVYGAIENYKAKADMEM